MDERMTICNMSIEGGARVGYVNPDQTTFDYLRGRRFAPQGDAFERACRWWRSMASDPDARRTTTRSRSTPRRSGPTVTWGINPGQSVYVDETLPTPADAGGPIGRRSTRRSSSWGSRPGSAIRGHADRRRVRRLVHQRAAVGSARGGAGRSRPARRAACAGAGRAGLAAGARRGRARRPRSRLHRRRIRLARRRLLDVPGDESRQARRAARSAPRRRTAISRDGRAVRPAARC